MFDILVTRCLSKQNERKNISEHDKYRLHLYVHWKYLIKRLQITIRTWCKLVSSMVAYREAKRVWKCPFSSNFTILTSLSCSALNHFDFFSFPSDKEQLLKWKSEILRSNNQQCEHLTKYTKVCANHFEFHDIIRQGSRSVLAKGAVPKRFTKDLCEERSVLMNSREFLISTIGLT